MLTGWPQRQAAPIVQRCSLFLNSEKYTPQHKSLTMGRMQGLFAAWVKRVAKICGGWR